MMTWSAAYTPPWLACKLLRCALVIITQLEIILVQYLLDYLCNMIISKAVVPSVADPGFLLTGGVTYIIERVVVVAG